jgi:hypothetical protein|nr:MAG TPA: hypothetical protein [Crassvirales sp.]
MKLLNFDNYQLKIADEALLVRPIRELYRKDKSKDKENFYEQMSYLYFMVDPRSTYGYIIDDTLRAKAIIEQEGLAKDFKPSKLLKEAMDIYKNHTVTKGVELLQSARKACDRVRVFLENIDLTEEDDKGKPKYQVSTVTTALKNVTDLVPQLQELEQKVEQEISEQSRVRGTDLSMFEDGF